MTKYDSIIFDLDGTLWDTSPIGAEAWNTILQKNNIAYREMKAMDVKKVTGKPHETCIRETFRDLSESKIKILLEYSENEENSLIAKKGGLIFPGVQAGLEALKEKYRLFIVSNCQSGYIETFLRNTGYQHFFDDFECWGNTRCSKGENIKNVIIRNHLKSSVYVGDTEGDQKAARECGIPFIFASYGFGQSVDFDFKINSFEDLVQQLK